MQNKKRFFDIIKTNLKIKYSGDQEKQDYMFYKIQDDYQRRQLELDKDFEEEDLFCEICFTKEEREKISIIDREERIDSLREYYKDKNVFPDDEMLELHEEKGYFGRTLLHQAVVDNDLEAVKKLSQQSLSIEAKDNSGYTPLMLAYLHKHEEIIEYLEDVILDKNY